MIDQPDVPPWVASVVTLALGAGGVKILDVWLENRRLTGKDYRETLTARIRELEKVVDGLYGRIERLAAGQAHLEEALEDERREVARLQEENDRLRAALQDMEDRDGRNPLNSGA